MKKLNFKKVGLIIKNNYIINRSVPLILFIVTLIIGSLIGAMPISDIESRYSTYIRLDLEAYENYRYAMESTYDTLTKIDGIFSIVSIVAAMIIPMLACLSINQYMRDKSGSDFYHSLCANRGELYAANFITVFLNTALTIIVANLSGLFFMNLMANYKPMTLWGLVVEQIPVVVLVVLVTAIFTALAMLSCVTGGTAFSCIVNYIVLNFAVPGTILCISVSGYSLFNTKLMDMLSHHSEPYIFTSPLLRYIFGAMGTYPFTAITYIALVALTLLLVSFGILVYCKKKNENSSMPLPFKCTVRPLQYLITFNAILLASTLFYEITRSMIWCAIGGLLALFFSFIAYNAFINKSFNGVFKGSRHMLYILIVTVAFGTVFVADIFKIYKAPTPDTDNLTSAYFHASYRIAEDERDREEWYSYNFELEESMYNIKLTEDNSEILAELYQLLLESELHSDGKYVIDNTDYLSVSMGIRCKNDLGVYHVYSTISFNSPAYERINEIIMGFVEDYPFEEENVYYYETTTSEIIDDEYPDDIDIEDEMLTPNEILPSAESSELYES